MARVTILGATGYAGAALVAELARRGHAVTSVSCTAPSHPVAGVQQVTGSVLDARVVEVSTGGADVVISALSPRGDLQGATRRVLQAVAAQAVGSGVPLGVVGGAGSLLVAPGGSKVSESAGFPQGFMAEAAEMEAVLEDLRAAPEQLDWFYVSPAAGFGAWAPGEATGGFRTGTVVLLADAEGRAEISAADLAIAIADEVGSPTHRGHRFTVAC